MDSSNLFKQINIGSLTIQNRIVMAAMAPIGLVNRDGGFTQRAIDYYAERAFGGVGLIITGVTKVPGPEPRYDSLLISAESSPTFGELAEVVHCFWSKVFVQLSPGYGHNLQGVVIDSGYRPISASRNPSYWRPDVLTRPLAVREIRQIVEAFGEAASLLKAAGIDGIELQGYGGYLLDEFTTARWNRRKDRYGGTLENRLRFPIELLYAIKEKAGDDFPVIYRYSVKHFMKGPRKAALWGESYIEVGRDIEEGLEMAKLMQKAGFDALDLNAGCYESWYWAYPPPYQPHGGLLDIASEVKKCVTIPVIVVGRLDVPELADEAIRDGKADMVALGRALLADPSWPKKVRYGRIEEIRPCLSCNDGCLYRASIERKSLSCAVNPSTGRERLAPSPPVRKEKRLLVAGGGIAGMEAARSAASRGYAVTLYEKGNRLGGHLIAACAQEFKWDLKRLLDWYIQQLNGLKVEIELQTEVTPEFVRKQHPDKAIVATGSVPIIPDIPGVEKPIVATCIDLLLDTKRAGKEVIVAGGGLVGCETALWLANKGKRVIIVEALPEVPTGDLFHSNRFMLIDMLKNKGVKFMVNTSLESVGEQDVTVVEKGFRRETVKCDTLALALGLRPERQLYDSLKDEGIELYAVGDCREPRKIMNAIWEAYYIASQ